MGRLLMDKYYVVKPFYDSQMFAEHLLLLMSNFHFYCYKNVSFNAVRSDVLSTEGETIYKNRPPDAQEKAFISQRPRENQYAQHWLQPSLRSWLWRPHPGEQAVSRLTLLPEEVVRNSLELFLPASSF